MNDVMIVGAGALGTFVGARLAEAGYAVQLLYRSASSALKVKLEGVTLETEGAPVTVFPDAVTAEDATPARFIMVFTKTYQSEEALRSVLPVLEKETVLVSLQNGLGNGERLAGIADLPVVHGVTMIPATLVQPGHVRSKGFTDTWLGALDASDPKAVSAAQTLADMLVKAQITAVNVADPLAKIWQKACFNVAMNGICALSDGGPGLVHDTPYLKAQAHALADEAAAVAKALSITIDEEALHNLIDTACAAHRFHQPSMLQDIRAQRLTEVDSLNGFIVERAKALNLAVPKNELMTGLLLGRQYAPEFWQTQGS